MREAAASMREKLFTMRMSDEEAARLDSVAKHYGLNAAGVIRMLVKREHDHLDPIRTGIEGYRQTQRLAEKPKKPKK